MTGAHAFLAPSAAGRWVKCALSAALEAAYPDLEKGPEAMDGEAGHWVVQRTAEGAPPTLGTQAPNGVAVTQEMQEGAGLVLETFERYLGPRWREMVIIERRIRMPRIHADHCWGTPDYYAWAWLPDGRRILFLFDYKFGHGVVEVEENSQLITYACGLLDEVPGLDDQNTVVSLFVIQPRSHHRRGPVRQWQVKASDLRAQINILHMQAEKATSPSPEAKPDPDACKNCKGRHACEALQRAAYQAADKGQQAQAVDLSPLALGRELAALTRAQALLSARVTGLQAQAEAVLRSGALIPFWSLDAAPGKLEWAKPAAEVFALGQMMGVDLAAPAKPITPTQAKKAGVPAALVDAYAERAKSAAKLTYDDGTKARLTFLPSDT